MRTLLDILARLLPNGMPRMDGLDCDCGGSDCDCGGSDGCSDCGGSDGNSSDNNSSDLGDSSETITDLSETTSGSSCGRNNGTNAALLGTTMGSDAQRRKRKQKQQEGVTDDDLDSIPGGEDDGDGDGD